MIVSFKDQASEDLFNGVASRIARKACPQTLWRIASRRLDQLDSVTTLDELKYRPAIDWNLYLVAEAANTAYASIDNIASASNGVILALLRWK